MAYDATKLVPQNPSAGPGTSTLYTYISDDDVEGAGYFNDAYLTLTVGDLINSVVTTATVPTGLKNVAVTAVDTSAKTVTVSDFTA